MYMKGQRSDDMQVWSGEKRDMWMWREGESACRHRGEGEGTCRFTCRRTARRHVHVVREGRHTGEGEGRCRYGDRAKSEGHVDMCRNGREGDMHRGKGEKELGHVDMEGREGAHVCNVADMYLLYYTYTRRLHCQHVCILLAKACSQNFNEFRSIATFES